MLTNTPFPEAGLPQSLFPNPPPSMPEPPGVPNATANMSPFTEPQRIEDVIDRLVLNRPLKLFIPDRERYPDHEFRIINSIPTEIAAAHNKGFRQVTNPILAALFTDLVAGVDKKGEAFRPLLFAREKPVGAHIAKQKAKMLASIYAGMDPANKQFDGKYTGAVDKKDGTFGNFSGFGFRIRY